MRNVSHRVGRDWLLVAEMVFLGAFAAGDASGLLQALSGKEVAAEWVFLGAIFIIGVTALARLGGLHDRIDRLEADVRVTARIGSISSNMPDPGPDKTRLVVHVFWEIWTDRDVVATDKLALNLIHVYDKPWWQFWKMTRFPQTGIPREGHTVEYREKIYNNMLMPYRDDAVFEYITDRNPSNNAHWLLELVLVTGVPDRRYCIPIEIGNLNRGNNPPL